MSKITVKLKLENCAGLSLANLYSKDININKTHELFHVLSHVAMFDAAISLGIKQPFEAGGSWRYQETTVLEQVNYELDRPFSQTRAREFLDFFEIKPSHDFFCYSYLWQLERQEN